MRKLLSLLVATTLLGGVLVLVGVVLAVLVLRWAEAERDARSVRLEPGLATP